MNDPQHISFISFHWSSRISNRVLQIIANWKSAFKVKQLIDHALSTNSMKCFKVSLALVASIWIGDLISDDLNPLNLSIWFCPERSHSDAKESELEKGLWNMDAKHVRSNIQLLSKTSSYVPDRVMDAYFMILSFRTLFQLLLRK